MRAWGEKSGKTAITAGKGEIRPYDCRPLCGGRRQGELLKCECLMEGTLKGQADRGVLNGSPAVSRT